MQKSGAPARRASEGRHETQSHSHGNRPRLIPRRNKRRRGVAVIIVLGLLAMTLALSYSMMRTQAVTVQIQGNSSRIARARQAAMAGISAGLRRMHQSDWQGVETGFSGTLETGVEYEVTYTSGDAALAPTDADYGELPYRVTVTSTGYAFDADNPDARAAHTIVAVARLVREQTGDKPTGWEAAEPYTVYQWRPGGILNPNAFMVEVPARMEGAVRVQGELQLCDDYPSDSASRIRLLGDLNQMRLNGLPDYRPFNLEVHLSYAHTGLTTRQLLTNQLGVATTDLAQSTSGDWPHPGVLAAYRLYEGGKAYAVPSLGMYLSDVTLEPDAATNPLGLFYRAGGLVINDNVTVRGTLIVDGGSANVQIFGENVSFEAAELAPLNGETDPMRLPSIIVEDDLLIRAGAGVAIKGRAIVFDDFRIDEDDQDDILLDIEGKLLAREVLLYGRNEWDEDGDWYSQRLSEFLAQKDVPGGDPYFPSWLNSEHGLNPAPRLTIRGDASSAHHHWQDFDEPLYRPLDENAGLKWEVVDWRE